MSENEIQTIQAIEVTKGTSLRFKGPDGKPRSREVVDVRYEGDNVVLVFRAGRGEQKVSVPAATVLKVGDPVAARDAEPKFTLDVA